MRKSSVSGDVFAHFFARTFPRQGRKQCSASSRHRLETDRKIPTHRARRCDCAAHPHCTPRNRPVSTSPDCRSRRKPGRAGRLRCRSPADCASSRPPGCAPRRAAAGTTGLPAYAGKAAPVSVTEVARGALQQHGAEPVWMASARHPRRRREADRSGSYTEVVIWSKGIDGCM
jgi:hypothetical protein